MSNHMIPAEAVKAAENAYRETLVDLRLTEGGGFRVASQRRRALHAALEAAAPYMLAEAGSSMQEAMRLAWEQGWANARGNYLALRQGQEIPEWVTLRNPYGTP